MTFIIAIQLEDSVIVAADNRMTIETASHENRYADTLQKIRFWSKGMISGAGESQLLERVFDHFQQHSNPRQLPVLLHEANQLRRLEIGQHPQLEKTRLIYSCVTPTGVGLQTISYENQHIAVHSIDPMTIELFVFNQDISPIYQQLIVLQQNLRNPQQCDSLSDWINYYKKPLSVIFKQFSLADHTVSASFDIYFQTPTQQLMQHIKAVV